MQWMIKCWYESETVQFMCFKGKWIQLKKKNTQKEVKRVVDILKIFSVKAECFNNHMAKASCFSV